MGVVLGYDPTFELNEFGKPKLLSEIELVKNTVMYILFSKPGQYPSLPNIGMDIEKLLYSFYDTLNVDDVKRQIVQQCAAMSVYINDGSIQIKKMMYKDQPSIVIYIQGKSEYMSDYLNETSESNQFMIGITFDEMHKMIYNISDRS